MRSGIFVAALLMAAAAQTRPGRTEWLGGAGQRVKAEIFGATGAGSASVLVIVLHGDAPFNRPSYQYTFAAHAAEKIRGAIAVALLRPGYTDPAGDTSDGKRGNTTADNYTPEVLDRIAATVRQLRAELHPSAVVLVGHSGGAAIAADLIARDPGLANGALLVSCPCDVPAFREHMKNVAPTPLWDAPVRSVSPLDVVIRIDRATRVRMIVGEKDNVAPPEFTQRYAAALKKHGVAAEVTVLPGRDHEILLDSAVMEELSKLIVSLR